MKNQIINKKIQRLLLCLLLCLLSCTNKNEEKLKSQNNRKLKTIQPIDKRKDFEKNILTIRSIKQLSFYEALLKFGDDISSETTNSINDSLSNLVNSIGTNKEDYIALRDLILKYQYSNPIICLDLIEQICSNKYIPPSQLIMLKALESGILYNNSNKNAAYKIVAVLLDGSYSNTAINLGLNNYSILYAPDKETKIKRMVQCYNIEKNNIDIKASKDNQENYGFVSSELAEQYILNGNLNKANEIINSALEKIDPNISWYNSLTNLKIKIQNNPKNGETL